MREQIARELQAQYANERAQALADAAERRAALEERIPELRAMNRSLSQAMLITLRDASRTDLTNEQKQRNARERVEEIRRRVQEALAREGISQDALEIRYKCPLCEDTGHVGYPIEEKCECYKRRFRQLLAKYSGMSSITEHTFQNFDLSLFPDVARKPGEKSQRAEMEAYRGYCEGYAAGYPDVNKCNLIFLGCSGLGKTYLLDCVANAVMDRGFTVLRITAFRLNEIARAYHMGRDEKGELELLLQADLLCVDDLGSEPMFQNVTIEYLLTILGERMENRRGTVFASNLSNAELRARYTERVTSRLFDVRNSKTFFLIGQDLRMLRR